MFKKLALAIALSMSFPSVAYGIDLSKGIFYPEPAPIVEHKLPHIPWTKESHNYFFDLVMTEVMDQDIDERYTTPMLIDAVQCMDTHFSEEYGFAEFLGNWEFPDEDFNLELQIMTELCFISSYNLHQDKEKIKYY